jgi:hypothetical protein
MTNVRLRGDSADRFRDARAKPQQSISTSQTEADDHDWIFEDQELMPQGLNLGLQRGASSKSSQIRRREFFVGTGVRRKREEGFPHSFERSFNPESKTLIDLRLFTLQRTENAAIFGAY